VSYREFIRKRRDVKLGGRRIGRLVLGGHWYAVGPMSTMRFALYLEQSKRLGDTLKDRGGIELLVQQTPARVLRPLVPLIVSEPLRDRDFRRCSDDQVYKAFRAWGEVNDLDAMLGSLDLSGGTGTKRGIDRLVLVFAREMHYRIEDVWAMPYRELLAAVRGLNAENAHLPEGADPLDDDEKRELSNLCAGMGMQVN
jgi:hypothetical protein